MRKPLGIASLEGKIVQRTVVSNDMNRLRNLGYIEHESRICVKMFLLRIVTEDRLPEPNGSKSILLDPLPSASYTAKRAKVA
jgi:hypothetical protein